MDREEPTHHRLGADEFPVGQGDAVLLAALLHAGWNALSKASGDALISITVISATGGVCALPLIIWLPAPGPETWPWLMISAVIHYVYQLCLVRTYQLGELSQVYPIARGSAPILVTLGALLFAGELLEPIALVGVICLAIGVMALTFDKSAGITKRPKAVLYALATAVCIASYTVVDGLGVRQAGSILQKRHAGRLKH